MRFSVWLSPGLSWEEIRELALHAEATGWDGVWFADHFMGPGRSAEGSLLECWSVLAGLAATVPRVRLGPLVSGNTYRHPAVLANAAAAVDRISGGRLVLGLGAGWQRNEHERYGIDFYDVPGRLERLEEACAVVRALTTEDRATFEGRHYHLDEAPLDPKPVQERLPILVGGGGERRTMRIAATWADEWNTWGTPETMAHKCAVLDRHCEAIGRDPSTIERSAQALVFMGEDQAWLAERRAQPQGMPAVVGTASELVEVVGAYQSAGLDELVVPDWTMPAEDRAGGLDAFFEQVAAGFR